MNASVSNSRHDAGPTSKATATANPINEANKAIASRNLRRSTRTFKALASRSNCCQSERRICQGPSGWPPVAPSA